MQAITYCLRGEGAGSDQYYNDAAAFTDEVLAMAGNLAQDLTCKYIQHLSENDKTALCPKEEHYFEFLTLGTLWQVYSGDATGLDRFPRQLLSGLARLRRQGGNLKPGIDFVRGIISTIFLSPDLYDNITVQEPTLEQMDRLLDWLDAAGEFGREVARLRRWRGFLESLPDAEASDMLATAITFAAWFEDVSEDALGIYTQNVDRYLNEVRPEKYWHEDVIFCGRRRVEYHLNMVGAEIMNRVSREEFAAAGRKAVLLPACMCMHPFPACKAVGDGDSLVCMGCSAGCSVNRLKTLGEKHDFDVLVVPHESSISSAGKGNMFIGPGTGIVGVACVLNLVSGGWMLKDMGIPAQCVVLDYCGCKNHWCSEGLPTEINISQLGKILGF